MIIICVTCQVKPGRGQQFLEAALRDREGTRKEAGNIRFDILQGATPANEGEPEQFFLFEIYHSAEDFAAHQQTPHFLLFREETADLMAVPRTSVRYVPAHTDSFVPAAVPNTEPTG